MTVLSVRRLRRTDRGLSTILSVRNMDICPTGRNVRSVHREDTRGMVRLSPRFGQTDDHTVSVRHIGHHGLFGHPWPLMTLPGVLGRFHAGPSDVDIDHRHGSHYHGHGRPLWGSHSLEHSPHSGHEVHHSHLSGEVLGHHGHCCSHLFLYHGLFLKNRDHVGSRLGKHGPRPRPHHR